MKNLLSLFLLCGVASFAVAQTPGFLHSQRVTQLASTAIYISQSHPIELPSFSLKTEKPEGVYYEYLESRLGMELESDSDASFFFINNRPTIDYNVNTAIAEFSRQHASGETRFLIYGYPNDPSIYPHLRKSTMLYATGDAESMVLCAVRPQGAIKFFTQSWQYPENQRMIINSEGNVGIGTPTPAARLQVAQGDIFIEDIQSGVIMRSPNGNCWRLTLDDNGDWVKNQIPCPN